MHVGDKVKFYIEDGKVVIIGRIKTIGANNQAVVVEDYAPNTWGYNMRGTTHEVNLRELEDYDG